MRLRLVDASLSEWDQAAKADPDATFSQGPAWHRVWADLRGYELVPQRLFCDGALCGILPLAVRKKALEVSYVSGPEGYGGILRDDEARGDPIAIIEALRGKLRSFSSLLNPFAPSHGPTASSASVPLRRMTSQYIDLDCSFEGHFRNWSKGHSSAAKKGIREGVTVRTASTEEDWKAYYEAYRDSLRRWGDSATSSYSWELFSALRRLGERGVRLWLAEFDSTVVAGALCLYGNRHVAYWHGAAVERWFHLKAPHVLQYRIIEDAIARGYRWYDMLTSGGHQGVAGFKKGFAAKEIECAFVSWRPAPLVALSRIRQWARRGRLAPDGRDSGGRSTAIEGPGSASQR